jgi:AcrR family transcriptional regulator
MLPPARERGRGRPPRTDQQRAAQRARLTEAAMNAVRHHGPDLSIDDIAAFAGVSKPVLYDEFGGKLGIADAVAVVMAEQFERSLWAYLSTSTTIDFGQAIRVAVESLITLITEEPTLYAFLVRSIRSSDRGFLDNALVRVIHDRATVLLRLMSPVVDQDVIAVLTDGLFGFLFAAVESWQVTRRPEKDELVDALASVISHGLRVTVEPSAR